MRVCPTVLGLIAIFSGLGSAQVTWPSSIDELEDVMFLNTGYKNRGFAAHITPCAFSEFGAGRQTAAEWLRIGFHDMATTNVFFEPHGGIDASIAYELNDGENVGAGFNTTLHTYAGFFNSRLPVSDLIALGVYASVRGCNGPVIPMRGGRVDAIAAGPLGVPQPQNGQGTFTNQFARMGFNVTDMIQMTACGHTLGGVHAGDFSNIVAPGTAPDDFQLFDTTPEFDNLIATRYIGGNDTDALAVGISTASGRNSDFAVFTADKNVTIQAMTNAATFNSMCISILQRMIETVPPTVNLSAIISPYEVKPSGLQLTLLSGGTQLTFSGDIRVRTTSRTVSSVQVVYTDRNGAAGGTISATLSGTANGFDDSFSFYGFSTNIPATTSISSFIVVVNTVGGSTQTFSNNGAGFPVQDSVLVQTPQSCYANGNLTVVTAVRSSVTTALNVTVTQKVASTSGSPIVSPLPSLSTATLSMVKGATIGPYVIYSGSASVASVTGAKFGAVSGSSADDFKDVSALGAICSPLGTSAPSSTSTSVISTSSTSVLSSSPSSTLSSSSYITSTSSAATPTPTLAHKQTVEGYTFQGCYTEGTGVRALGSASFYNYTAMTIEMCASDCSGYSYFGVEYGGECYCGNTLASTSALAALSDCSFICPGNSYEYCGAGNRLEMYLLSTSASSSSSLVSSSSVAISSLSSTSSSTSASASPTPQIVKSAGLYNYFGCYTEGANVRALGAASYPNDANTIESCVAACSPYLYAGAEYGRECWCADSFGAGATLAPDSDCSMTCAGNQYEFCGAGDRLSVYIRNGTVSSVSSTTTTSKV
ncbi:heme peroxidase [Acephala macrosclerotiorum]|nr:heme peroxidase [Acephala macrosclerotiorum]